MTPIADQKVDLTTYSLIKSPKDRIISGMQKNLPALRAVTADLRNTSVDTPFNRTTNFSTLQYSFDENNLQDIKQKIKDVRVRARKFRS